MLKIRWHGHACFEITNETTLVTDPHDGKSIGIPAPNVTGDIILVSHDHYDHNSVKSVEKEKSTVITDEKKRNISNISIQGYKSFHDESHGEKRGENIIYKFIIDDITFCHLGDLGHELDEDIIQEIGKIDILFIPIGGTFTIDADTAWKVIDKIKPCITIPMHYKIGGLSLPIAGIEPFLEKNKLKVLRVGNEIEIEKDDLPTEPEIWIFTL
ncbi:MAG: Zn-dependent hydrolase [Thermoplasmata archaeon]|nr:MAG: Zn-dependent hydrolase [Thermoplasmata archaeon]